MIPAGLPAARWRLGLWISVALLASVLLHPLQDRDPFIDGQFYVSALHSLYADGDVDLTNEAKIYPWLRWYSVRTEPPPGGLRNPFPIGPALLWAPFYAAYDPASRMSGGEGISPATGPVHAPVYFATTFWVVLGLFVLADTLRQLGASRGACLAVPAIVLTTSPLPAYVIFAPDMAHGCSFATVSVLLWTSVWSWRGGTPDGARWLACGLALGLAFTVRWQDAALGLIPFTLLMTCARGADTPRRVWVGLAWLGFGVLIGIAPQLAYWKALYGSWLTLPQGGGFLRMGHADPLAFFFSTWNGLFLSHPALLLFLAGFALPWKGLQPLRFAALAAIGVELVACILVVDWWSGGSFGQRRVVSILPILGLGALPLWRIAREGSPAVRRAALAATLALFVGWNALSLVRLYDGALPYNPSDRDWYADGSVYGHYEYGRRFSHLLFGVKRGRTSQ